MYTDDLHNGLLLLIYPWMFTLVENSTGSEKTVMVGWRGKAGSGRLGGTGGRLPTSQPTSQPRMK
jgi:hypothetical protein